MEKSYISIGDQVADFLTKAVSNESPDSVIDIDCKVVNCHVIFPKSRIAGKQYRTCMSNSTHKLVLEV